MQTRLFLRRVLLGSSLAVGCGTFLKARPPVWAHAETLLFSQTEEDDCSQTHAFHTTVGRARLEWSEGGDAQLTFEKSTHSMETSKREQRRVENHDCTRAVFAGRAHQEGETKRMLFDRVTHGWYWRGTDPARRLPVSEKSTDLRLICRVGPGPEGTAGTTFSCEVDGQLDHTPLRKRRTPLVFARAGDARLEMLRLGEDSSFRYAQRALEPSELEALTRCEFGR